MEQYTCRCVFCVYFCSILVYYCQSVDQSKMYLPRREDIHQWPDWVSFLATLLCQTDGQNCDSSGIRRQALKCSRSEAPNSTMPRHWRPVVPCRRERENIFYALFGTKTLINVCFNTIGRVSFCKCKYGLYRQPLFRQTDATDRSR